MEPVGQKEKGKSAGVKQNPPTAKFFRTAWRSFSELHACNTSSSLDRYRYLIFLSSGCRPV